MGAPWPGQLLRLASSRPRDGSVALKQRDRARQGPYSGPQTGCGEDAPAAPLGLPEAAGRPFRGAWLRAASRAASQVASRAGERPPAPSLTGCHAHADGGGPGGRAAAASPQAAPSPWRPCPAPSPAAPAPCFSPPPALGLPATHPQPRRLCPGRVRSAPSPPAAVFVSVGAPVPGAPARSPAASAPAPHAPGGGLPAGPAHSRLKAPVCCLSALASPRSGRMLALSLQTMFFPFQYAYSFLFENQRGWPCEGTQHWFPHGLLLASSQCGKL